MQTRVPLEMAFAQPSTPPPVSRLPRDWHGFSAEHVSLETDAPYSFKSLGKSHYLALHDMSLRDGELKIEGLPTYHVRDLRDTITFVPRGCAIEGWAHPEVRANSFVAMYFDPEAIRDDLGARYARDDPAPFAYARDPKLASTLDKLGALVCEPEVDDLHAESLCLLASLEVFGVLADPQGKLSDRQLSSVTDYVEAHLHEGIGLDDLASVAGLSRFHFSRVFKATTGQNPHAFVQQRRIARAQQLLSIGDLPIDGVALAVGYRGATQFRRVFRDVTGLSPQQYRQQRR